MGRQTTADAASKALPSSGLLEDIGALWKSKRDSEDPKGLYPRTNRGGS